MKIYVRTFILIIFCKGVWGGGGGGGGGNASMLLHAMPSILGYREGSVGGYKNIIQVQQLILTKLSKYTVCIWSGQGLPIYLPETCSVRTLFSLLVV